MNWIDIVVDREVSAILLILVPTGDGDVYHVLGCVVHLGVLRISHLLCFETLEISCCTVLADRTESI